MAESWQKDVFRYVREMEVKTPEDYSVDLGTQIQLNGESAEIVDFLDSGGEKEIYDVAFDGERKAMKLPNTVKFPDKIAENWQSVIREPEHAEVVGEAGLNVNNYVERFDVDINGYKFPTVLMDRYRDHDFDIYDKKNSRERHDFFERFETYEDLFEGVMDDIAVMMQESINLAADSFNICEKEGVPHLYFADLTDPNSKDIDEKYAEYFIHYAIGAMVDTARISDQDDIELGHISHERKLLEESLQENLLERI